MGGDSPQRRKPRDIAIVTKTCPWKHQPRGIAGTQEKHFMCLGEKPGLGELSESLATVAGRISTPGNIALLQQPFSKHPRGCKNLLPPVL